MPTAAFSLLRGTELSGTVTDVRHVFAAPSFDALLARPADPVEGLIYRGVLTLREAGGKATPFAVRYSPMIATSCWSPSTKSPR